MSIFMQMFPSDYISSFYDYDFEAAYKCGRRLILFDIDNTLVPHGAPADEHCMQKMTELKRMGFKLCAVSNNKEPRVKSFCGQIGAGYIYSAGKPSVRGYEQAMRLNKSCKEEAIFFGDQIFTDIIGARRAGIYSVLVKPIDLSSDEIQIKFKRFFEKPVIRAYFSEKGLAISDYFH